MKKLVIVLNLVCMFALGSFAQSMYGDAAKADVKMKYVYSFEEALKRAKEEHKLIFFNCFADYPFDFMLTMFPASFGSF